MNRAAGAPAIDRALSEATEWLLTLQRADVTPEHIAAWQRWLGEDPRNKLAFDRLQGVQECIDAVDPVPWPSAEEMENDDYAGTVAVSEQLRHPRTHTHRRIRKFRWSLAAAAGIAALAVLLGYQLAGTAEQLSTGVGELRRVQLDDGSSVTLGGRTEVAIDYDADYRNVTLKHGEAFFEVAKDAQRPFVVSSAGHSIRAVGTSFNVRQAASGVTVSVSEGVVEISPAGTAVGTNVSAGAMSGTTRLQAGDRLRIEALRAGEPSQVAPGAVAAWREGERQYLAEPLAEVVADLARYSARRIVIEDSAIGRLQVTGAVFERELDRWLESLPSALPVSVTTGRDGTVRIRARTKS